MSAMEAAIYVNDGPPVRGGLDVHVAQIEVTGCTKKDLSWEFTDAAGHYHAYTEAGDTPTLIRREEYVAIEAEPDGDPDDTADALDEDDGEWDDGEAGYTVVHWHCRICDEEIKPRWTSSLFREFAPGRKSWTVTVQAHVEQRTEVSVRIVSGDRMLFGVATATDEIVSGGPGRGVLSTTTLIGIGELGQRRAPRVAA